MTDACAHLTPDIDPAPAPHTPRGCEECLQSGGSWKHLRLCLQCAHVGCCDDSPNKHASTHFQATGHPLMRSYEPGEDWFWCFVDEVGFEVPGAPPAPSHA